LWHWPFTPAKANKHSNTSASVEFVVVFGAAQIIVCSKLF
jgi:hypothetical protein